MSEAERLLDSVSRIAKHHEELKKARGETFNIFSILKVDTLEMAHSRFIKELLDPKGEHGMGDVFLRNFIRIVQLDFRTNDVEVHLEVHLGAKTETAGGRIDIQVTGPNGRLLIENKIWAGDQEAQVLRYLNSAPNAQVIYLTLDGREPNCLNDIADESKERLKCISYDKEVLLWLEDCYKHAVRHPILRETIRQYIILIHQLTGHNLSHSMNTEIIDRVLVSDDSLDAYIRLLDAEWEIRKRIWRNMFSKLEEAAYRYGFKVSASTEDNHSGRYASLDFEYTELTEINLSICFQFESINNRDLGFGFFKKSNFLQQNIHQRIKNNFVKRYGQGGESENDYWLVHSKWIGEWAFWNLQTYKKLHSGEFVRTVMEKVMEMLDLFREVNLEKHSSGDNPNSR